jgi:DNA-directed RNA polymerase subunit RPC12/RpoP
MEHIRYKCEKCAAHCSKQEIGDDLFCPDCGSRLTPYVQEKNIQQITNKETRDSSQSTTITHSPETNNKQNKTNLDLSPKKNAKKKTAIRAKIGGIMLSALMLISVVGLTFSGEVQLITLPILVVLAVMFFIGIGVFFKNKVCWYIAIIYLIFFIITRLKGWSDFNNEYPGKSIALTVEVLVSLPFIVPLLLLFSDRPNNWD